MRITKRSILSSLLILVPAVLPLAGCQSGKHQCCENTAVCAMPPAVAPTAPAVATPAPAAPAAAAPMVAAPPVAAATDAQPAPAATPVLPPVRIKAGSFNSFKDSEGNVWLPDQGFADGDMMERSDVPIANTKSPAIYQGERYGMTSFSYPVPNGKYIVKLHFAETFEGITGPGERVFAINVAGHEFKNFDVWVKAGGPMRAWVETVNVEVTGGKLEITFTAGIENPEINGIEILPES